jgi:hypothetical protein
VHHTEHCGTYLVTTKLQVGLANSKSAHLTRCKGILKVAILVMSVLPLLSALVACIVLVMDGLRGSSTFIRVPTKARQH